MGRTGVVGLQRKGNGSTGYVALLDRDLILQNYVAPTATASGAGCAGGACEGGDWRSTADAFWATASAPESSMATSSPFASALTASVSSTSAAAGATLGSIAVGGDGGEGPSERGRSVDAGRSLGSSTAGPNPSGAMVGWAFASTTSAVSSGSALISDVTSVAGSLSTIATSSAADRSPVGAASASTAIGPESADSFVSSASSPLAIAAAEPLLGCLRFAALRSTRATSFCAAVKLSRSPPSSSRFALRSSVKSSSRILCHLQGRGR